jgi:ubiquitin-protein ligase
LLSNPIIEEEPLVPEIAKLFLKNRAAYEENVKVMTREYAMDEN